MREYFLIWLGRESDLSYASCVKYYRAIDTISKKYIERNVLSNNLYNLDSQEEFHKEKNRLLEDDGFQKQDGVGHRMYSRALKYYEKFLSQKNTFNDQ